MAKKGYILSEEDVRELKTLKHLLDRLPQNPRQRPYYPQEQLWTPEAYIVRASSSGIPALSQGATDTGAGLEDDVPGSAVCSVYRIVSGVLESTDIEREIFNLSTEAIEANAWVMAVRDKFGSWVAVRPDFGIGGEGGIGTGTGGGSEFFLTVGALDLDPLLTDIAIVLIDETYGLTVKQGSATNVAEISITPASTALPGVVVVGPQTISGRKTIQILDSSHVGLTIEAAVSQVQSYQNWTDAYGNVESAILSTGAGYHVPYDFNQSGITVALITGHALIPSETGTGSGAEPDPMAGFGVRHSFTLQTTREYDRQASDITAFWVDPEDASRTSALEIAVYYTGMRKIAFSSEADSEGEYARGVVYELSLGSPTTKTISGGAFTKDRAFHFVAGESASADNLDTVNGGNDGDILILMLADEDDPITLRHEVGDLSFRDESNHTLATERDVVAFKRMEGLWRELFRNFDLDPAIDLDPTECGIRITLTEGDPVGPDVTTASVIRTAAFFSSYVYLKEVEGGDWSRINCAGLALNLDGLGLSPHTNHFLYLHHSSGTPSLTAVAWSGTPAADNVRVDGVLMKASDQKKRLVGWFRTGATGQETHDHDLRRYLVNSTARCRVRKPLRRTDTGDWTPAVGWNYANFNLANQVIALVGPGHEQLVELEARGMMAVTSDEGGIHSLQQMSVGIGINALGNHADITLPAFSFWDATHSTSVPGHGFASLRHRPGPGIYVYIWTEKAYVSEGATIRSFGTGYHDQVAGLLGSVDC